MVKKMVVLLMVLFGLSFPVHGMEGGSSGGGAGDEAMGASSDSALLIPAALSREVGRLYRLGRIEDANALIWEYRAKQGNGRSKIQNQNFDDALQSLLDEDVEALRRVLDKDSELVMATTSAGYTLLMISVWTGDVACVQELLARGSDRSAVNNYNGRTALEEVEYIVRHVDGASMSPRARQRRTIISVLKGEELALEDATAAVDEVDERGVLSRVAAGGAEVAKKVLVWSFT